MHDRPKCDCLEKEAFGGSLMHTKIPANLICVWTKFRTKDESHPPVTTYGRFYTSLPVSRSLKVKFITDVVLGQREERKWL